MFRRTHRLAKEADVTKADSTQRIMKKARKAAGRTKKVTSKRAAGKTVLAKAAKPTEAMLLRTIGKRGRSAGDVHKALGGKWSAGAVRGWLNQMLTRHVLIAKKSGRSVVYCPSKASTVTQAIRSNAPEAAQVH